MLYCVSGFVVDISLSGQKDKLLHPLITLLNKCCHFLCFSLKRCLRLLADVLTTLAPCQLRDRKPFVSTESIMRPPLRLLTHIRPLTVSPRHPLNLGKTF